ncbi:hypothetical protein WAF17_06645 [Bernardetia sp. ABR2-2B]|uniref:DUF3108 domain-containing protein n=1 Tax=Bernardetia sp. ABR2-2B TaxID=3127472 RepID=UPI0030D37D14
MKYILSFLFIFIILNNIQAQIDTVNTQTDVLEIKQLQESKNSYIVYIQDSIYKSNFEIWDRTVSKNENTYQLHWTRHTNDKDNFHKYLITFDEKLCPLSEKVVHQELKNEEQSVEKKHFIYEENKMYSDKDTTIHNTEPFEIDDLKHSFNWELDLEVLSALPLEEDKQFAISFYHPASKTPPKYYKYWVDRSEEISLNNKSMDCWVVKVIYSEYQSSEFWIDKSTHRVLQMKEGFFGKYRFKKLIL